jgi:hypothetical protein
MLRKTQFFTMAAAGFSLVAPMGSASAAVKCAVVSDANNGAYSCFIRVEDGDELKGFADKANKGVSQFFMSVGKNDNSLKDIVVNTIGAVDTDDGYGEIKPAKNNVLTSASFTVTTTSTVNVDGMFFRGQFEDIKNGSAFNGDLFANVVAKNGNLTQFEWTGLPTNADHILLGVDETTEPGPLLGTVDLFVQAGEMKSLKQIDFSVPGSTPRIPEPSTWGMMLLGFAGLGFVGYRQTRKAKPETA